MATHALKRFFPSPLAMTVLAAALQTSGAFAQPDKQEPATLRPGAMSKPDSVEEMPQVTITEHAEPSYKAEEATVAGKVPTEIRKIPNSVSILTRRQMDEQNLVTTADAMGQMTGVQVISNNLSHAQYHARGGALEMQQDGVPLVQPLSNYRQFDNAIYERIEIQRGPSGLLQGSGAFSGTVNLVRKRPLPDAGGAVQATLGSWNYRHGEIDASAPLNTDKSLRGRVVLSGIDRDYMWNRAHTRKGLLYGTLDYDFSPKTRLNVYVAHQSDRSSTFTGLPAYTNGTNLSVPRSFNPYPDWAYSKWRTTEVGGELTHLFGDRWQATLKGMHRGQRSFFKDGYAADGVDPVTGRVSSYTRREWDYNYDHNSVDMFAAGPFSLFGREHKLLLGANWSEWKSAGQGANPTLPSTRYLRVPDVLLADPPAVPEPDVAYTTGNDSVTSQWGIYGRAVFNVSDPLKVMIGGRFSDYRNKSRSYALARGPSEWQPGAHESGVFTPYAGITYDLNDRTTLYGSYSEIFVPQTQRRSDGSVLPPRKGGQYEIGAKTEWLDGQLATNVAAFRIRDVNRALQDDANPEFYVPAGVLQSKGWEFEVTGRLTPQWDIAAGYTRLSTRWLNNGPSTGRPASFWYPKHLYKLWTHYRFADGPLRGMTAGLGLQGMSQAASGSATPAQPARRQGAYTVVNAQLGYTFNDKYSVTLNVNNLFDKKYYTRLGSVSTYNTYGDARNAMLTLKAKF